MDETTNTVVTDLRRIAHRYMRSWFLVDLFSVVPFELLSLMPNSKWISNLSVLRLVRLLRLVKLVRLLRTMRILKRHLADYAIRYSHLALAQFGVQLVIIAHWMACFYIRSVCLFTQVTNQRPPLSL